MAFKIVELEIDDDANVSANIADDNFGMLWGAGQDIPFENNAPLSGVRLVKKLPESKIQEFYQQKVRKQPAQILPPAVRYISDDNTLVVWEQRPGYRTINYTPRRQAELSASGVSRNTFRIPVPWHVFIISYSEAFNIASLYMFFTEGPIKSFDDTMFLAPINNFYGSGSLCLAAYDDLPVANNLFQLLGNAYDMVWNSGFNDDLSQAIDYSMRATDRHNPVIYGAIDLTREGFYRRWASIDLDKIVQTKWASTQKKLDFYIKSQQQAASHNYSVVDFVMNLQDIT